MTLYLYRRVLPASLLLKSTLTLPAVTAVMKAGLFLTVTSSPTLGSISCFRNSRTGCSSTSFGSLGPAPYSGGMMISYSLPTSALSIDSSRPGNSLPLPTISGCGP